MGGAWRVRRHTGLRDKAPRGLYRWFDRDFRHRRQLARHGGPFVRADLQDGESYDARLEQPGCDRAEFDASTWASVVVVSSDTAKLVPQPDEPVRATELVPASIRTMPAPGEYVYDLGQNMVGVARVRMTGRKGQTVRIRYAEELVSLGVHARPALYRQFPHRQGHRYLHLRARWHVTYQPTFTQHGFRYIEITGLDTPPESKRRPGRRTRLRPVRHGRPASLAPDARSARAQHPLGTARQFSLDPDRHAGARRTARLDGRHQRLRAHRVPATRTRAPFFPSGWTTCVTLSARTATFRPSCLSHAMNSMRPAWVGPMRSSPCPTPSGAPPGDYAHRAAKLGRDAALLSLRPRQRDPGRQLARRGTQLLVLRRLVEPRKGGPTRGASRHRHRLFRREHPHDGGDGGGDGREPTGCQMGSAGAEDPRGVRRRLSPFGRFHPHRYADCLRAWRWAWI